ncbi:hypothetical protein PGT21_030244 [Puccinia graminis f. sp. tritici]|uniref:Uncharacterized protein n=1 Tax=Puccinia graminis f. sp. tritici TaxID=56615 RepID=A0A5B0MZ95_PUCGR|nr:hypothetical protein PGT21_030244 [Puccinia graminis f. sp. tritici]
MTLKNDADKSRQTWPVGTPRLYLRSLSAMMQLDDEVLCTEATTPPPTPSIRVPWLGGLPINPHHYAAAPPVTSRGTKARARS